MTSVNRVSQLKARGTWPPLPLLLERVERQMLHDLGQQRSFRKLRAQDPTMGGGAFRILSFIPAAGGRITDVAARAGVSKQALGQFVDTLELHGYVERRTDDADRRSRIVVRTSKGERALALTHQMFAEIEEQWRGRVGDRRWATFRSVLTDLAVDAPPLDDEEMSV